VRTAAHALNAGNPHQYRARLLLQTFGMSVGGRRQAAGRNLVVRASFRVPAGSTDGSRSVVPREPGRRSSASDRARDAAYRAGSVLYPEANQPSAVPAMSRRRSRDPQLLATHTCGAGSGRGAKTASGPTSSGSSPLAKSLTTTADNAARFPTDSRGRSVYDGRVVAGSRWQDPRRLVEPRRAARELGFEVRAVFFTIPTAAEGARP
jgi:hypothetical protein